MTRFASGIITATASANRNRRRTTAIATMTMAKKANAAGSHSAATASRDRRRAVAAKTDEALQHRPVDPAPEPGVEGNGPHPQQRHQHDAGGGQRLAGAAKHPHAG